MVRRDPGIGKSRLLEELALAVDRAGGTVLRGRAHEAEGLRPYGIWIDALSTEARSGDAPGRFGWIRDGLFDAIVERIARLATERPTAIVLDDVQWIDEPSAAILHFVARTVGDGRLLLAFGSRSGELQDNAACVRAVRALVRERRLELMRLEPLDAPSIAQLVGTVGEGIDTERVWSESRGNPLIALEVARALRRGGAPLSGMLERLVADRLPLHDGPSRDVLSWMAAFGRPVPLARLAEATQLPAAQVLTAVERLERLALVKLAGEDGYDFVHDLVRRVVYRRIPEPRRRLLCLRIAEVLAGIPDGGAVTDGC